MAPQPETVAVLGIGSMGHGMATTALRAGIPTIVWNRGAEPTRETVDAGRFESLAGRVNAELPLRRRSTSPRRRCADEDVAAQMPCGSDVQRYLAGIREFEAAGFTHLALVQVGADKQEEFIPWAASELLPALRSS